MGTGKICTILIALVIIGGCSPKVVKEKMFVEKDCQGVYRVFDSKSGEVSYETKDEADAVGKLMSERENKKKVRKCQ